MKTRPHLIQILSDEHCGFALSSAGDPNVHTPNLDRLAAEGVRFANAYANCPVCTPSRGTIFSGRHAHAGPVPGFFDVYGVIAQIPCISRCIAQSSPFRQFEPTACSYSVG